MGLKEFECEKVYWFHLVQGRVRWLALVKTTKMLVQYKAGLVQRMSTCQEGLCSVQLLCSMRGYLATQ